MSAMSAASDGEKQPAVGEKADEAGFNDLWVRHVQHQLGDGEAIATLALLRSAGQVAL